MDHLELIAVVGTVFIVFVIALVALRSAYQHKADAAAFRERMNHYKDLATTQRDHITQLRDKVANRDQQLITLSKQLTVAMKMNIRDNEFSAPAPFPETQPMPLDGLITTYQKQKQ